MKMLAFDLGASSGKIFLGEYNGKSLMISEVDRFDNHQVVIREELFWDVLEIYRKFVEGVSKVIRTEKDIVSIGLDSFSNDFGLLDSDGRFVTQVHCYRDGRTKRAEDKIYAKISKEKLHKLCGNQNALFGTLMQLAAMSLEEQAFLLNGAGSLLFIPDLFIYFLTGEIRSEYTITSVSQMMDFEKRDWSAEIINTFGIPKRILPAIANPGEKAGKIEAISGISGNGNEIEVVTVCEHDTASAFLAAPYGENSVIISSGTWSLVGVETKEPIINDYTFRKNIANEGGYPGHHRMLKNVMGQWIIQESRKYYTDHGKEFTYGKLMEMAEEEKSFHSVIDPDDERFFSPGRMPEKVMEYCRDTNQKIPDTPGKIMSCIVASLAFQYRRVIEELEEVVGKKYSRINIVGGGSNNRTLNQCVANVTGRKVYSGPDEATALGNMLVQLLSFGEIASITQGRELILNSFNIDEYEPASNAEWDERYQQYIKIVSG